MSNVQNVLLQKAKEAPAMILALLKTRKFWVELIIMTLGMIVTAAGIHFFLIPSKLIVGSITGLSLVVAQWIPGIGVGTIIFVINAILLVLSFLLIGNEFGAKTVYTALILGPFVDLFNKIIPMKESIFTSHQQVLDSVGNVVGNISVVNPWFDLLCFVVILSGAQTVLFMINASTGGLDILAKIINKYFNVNLGNAVTVAGFLICCTAFTINPVGLVIIGLIGTWFNGMVITHFMSGLSSKTRVCIISKDHEKLRQFIVNEIQRGVTLHEVIGGYSNEKSMEVEVLLTRDEFTKLMTFIDKEKLHTFITANSVSEVYGLWSRKRKKLL